MGGNDLQEEFTMCAEARSTSGKGYVTIYKSGRVIPTFGRANVETPSHSNPDAFLRRHAQSLQERYSSQLNDLPWYGFWLWCRVKSACRKIFGHQFLLVPRVSSCKAHTPLVA